MLELRRIVISDCGIVMLKEKKMKSMSVVFAGWCGEGDDEGAWFLLRLRREKGGEQRGEKALVAACG